MTVAEILKENGHELAFTIIEAGAQRLNASEEPFYELLDTFPKSRIIALEVDDALCTTLSASARPGLSVHCCALGKAEEERDFYVTEASMCCSLYKPNEELTDLFHEFQFGRLKKVIKIQTISLDHFVEHQRLGEIDFIKIDIQGAELEVFQGGQKTLPNVVCIVTEVEHVPLYVDQPLLGDITAFLTKQGFMFHKFLSVGGRSFLPLVVNNDPFLMIQQMWSDALYIRNPVHLDKLSGERILKLAVLAEVYGSPDLTTFLLKAFDQRSGTDLESQYVAALTGSAFVRRG